jgi:choline kinase
MHEYPKLNYIFNPCWATTNNSYSLSLALSNNPVIILSGDLIFEKKLIRDLINCNHNSVVTKNNFNRNSNSLNAIIDKKKNIRNIYQGKIKSINDREAMGIFLIKDRKILNEIKDKCNVNKKGFVAENLPFNKCEFKNFDATYYRLDEINNPEDFLSIKKKYNI